tara:strand:+ start:6191 stop:6466 length:276 start_codon:yes stop_codon:yes gene_type:complete
LVEQRTENPRVGGSNPPPGTIKAPVYWGFFVSTPHYNIAHIAHINHIVTNYWAQFWAQQQEKNTNAYLQADITCCACINALSIRRASTTGP